MSSQSFNDDHENDDDGDGGGVETKYDNLWAVIELARMYMSSARTTPRGSSTPEQITRL